MRISFKKGSSYSGLMRLPPTYRVKCDGKEVATIQCCERFVKPDSLWFWYGDGQNTYNNPQPLDICKDDVRGHFQRKFSAEPHAVLDGDKQ